MRVILQTVRLGSEKNFAITHNTLRHLNFLNPSLKLLPLKIQFTEILPKLTTPNFQKNSECLVIFLLSTVIIIFKMADELPRWLDYEKWVFFDISILVYNNLFVYCCVHCCAQLFWRFLMPHTFYKFYLFTVLCIKKL